MVAKITTPARLLAALHYNENKVKSGKAVCLHAKGFLRSEDSLTFQQKQFGFERLNNRNERAQTKTLHISLNFDPSEKLSKQKLIAVAEAYLTGIGFADQPALVYQHLDAGHPHIHIVTNTIREDGSRINTHNIGRNQSETTRKALEEQFGLVRASTKKSSENLVMPTLPIAYGKSELKKYIQQVVSQVTGTYLFSSLPELNAVLRKYHVIADKGSAGSRIQNHHGLTYRMTTATGEKIGVPVKASSLSGNPGLKKLESLFEKNAPAKDPFKKPLKAAIDGAIKNGPATLEHLAALLANQHIETVLRKSADGRIYGITFIDERNKVVINGSDLGKSYSAAHLAATLAGVAGNKPSARLESPTEPTGNRTEHENTLEFLLQPEPEFNPAPAMLKKKRKRKHKQLKR